MNENPEDSSENVQPATVQNLPLSILPVRKKQVTATFQLLGFSKGSHPRPRNQGPNRGLSWDHVVHNPLISPYFFGGVAFLETFFGNGAINMLAALQHQQAKVFPFLAGLVIALWHFLPRDSK